MEGREVSMLRLSSFLSVVLIGLVCDHRSPAAPSHGREPLTLDPREALQWASDVAAADPAQDQPWMAALGAQMLADGPPITLDQALNHFRAIGESGDDLPPGTPRPKVPVADLIPYLAVLLLAPPSTLPPELLAIAGQTDAAPSEPPTEAGQ
jgi:hypothetical protein